MKAKDSVAIIVSLFILISSITAVLMINVVATKNENTVYNGVLDLSREQGEKLLSLDGDWEFYPGIFTLEPENHQDEKILIQVPGNFQNVEDAKTEGGFAGTYRLIIKTHKKGSYGIKTNTIRTASKVFANGDEVFSIGNPSLNQEGHAHGSKYEKAAINTDTGEIELIIHVSSYEYREAGILKSIIFGSYEQISRKDEVSRTIDIISVAICLVFTIYAFLSWLHRRKDLYWIYASLASFFMAIYISILREQILYSFFKYSFHTRIKVQIFSMLIMSFCFLKFIQHFYKELKESKIIKALSIILLCVLALIFIGAEITTSTSMGVIQLMVSISLLVSFAYITLALFKLFLKKINDDYTVIIASSLLTYWCIMVLKILFEIEISYVPIALVIVINFSVLLLISNKLQEDKREALALSEELSVREKMKNDFLIRTSNELMAPLHIIKNLSSIMIEGEKGHLNIEQQENMFFILMEGRKLVKLVEDLVDASTIDAEKLRLNKQMIYPSEITEKIVLEYSILNQDRKEVEIINQVAENFKAIYVDLYRFRQIFINLIDNALKHTEKGTIVIRAIEGEGMAEFQVSDTGTGIDSKSLPNIFDSLYKGKGDTGQGLGLGLTIVKQLVENHGGRIWVESQPNKGSVFHFTLPYYDKNLIEKYQDDLMKKDTNEKVEAGHTILLLDEISHGKMLKEILTIEGYDVIQAKTEAELFETLKSHNIDLIIIDLALSNKFGYEICRKIRKGYTMAELPILMLTASNRGWELNQIIDCGGNDFIKKPTEAKELKSRVRSLLLMKASYEAGIEKEFYYFYSQLSPHFLYNTLSTIIGLSYSDMGATRKALDNLGTYIRGKMDSHKSNKFASLESEVELAMAYLEIEKLRYGDRLSIDIVGDSEIPCMIPPLTLQPLVENSVRYGINKREKLKIVLKIKEQGDKVNISIKDNGPGISDDEKEKLIYEEGKGLGLTNVIRRIHLMRDADIDIKDNPTGGTLIEMRIGKEKYDASNLS